MLQLAAILYLNDNFCQVKYFLLAPLYSYRRKSALKGSEALV